MNSAGLRMATAVAACQDGLITAAQLLEAGVSRGSLAHRLATRQTRAALPGVYLLDAWTQPESWDALPLATRARAAVLMHGEDTVFVLDTAARLLGISGVGRDPGPVQIQLPPGRERHQVEGVIIHTRKLDPCDRTSPPDARFAHLTVTTPGRTVLDLVLDAAAGPQRLSKAGRRLRAVSILDSALNGGMLLDSDLPRLQDAAFRRRGAAISRNWWRLADGRAQSPLETDVRLIAWDAGLPPDTLQIPIHDIHGTLLGYGDLAWRRPGRRWLVAEAHGAEPHDRPRALYRDRHRANDFVATGDIDVIRFTYADCRRPAYVVSTLRRHLRR